MRSVKTIVVIGGGVMGRGIAQVAAQREFETLLVDISNAVLESARDGIEKFLNSGVQKGKVIPEDAVAAMGRLSFSTDLENAAPQADFVIEAVVENVAVKSDLLARLNDLCDPDVILASNTSQISITQLGRASKRPDRFIGMHWFNPAPLMRLVEIPCGLETSDQTREAVVDLVRRLGKEPAVCKDSPGFVVSRILNVWYNEGMRLVDEGVASIEEVDRAVRAGGFRMGPLELRDLVGLDIGLEVSRSLHERLGSEKFRPPECLKLRAAAGHLGRKTGRGFYRYS